jgi:hypothetical protein
MAKFTVTNSLGGTQQAMSATYKTLVALTCQTTPLERFRIYEIIVGTNGTPADNYIEYDVSLQTAAGTATPVTPRAIDPADQGTNSTICAVNATAEGTITAASSVHYVGMNQRASGVIFKASKEDEMLNVPAVNLAGLAFRARSGAYTGTVTITVRFME